MRVQFDRDEYRVAPGADVRLHASVSSDFDGPVDVIYSAEISGKQAAGFRLAVTGPPRLQPGQQTPVTVTIGVPRKATVAPEPRLLRLRTTLTGSQVSASGETAVIVSGKRCAKFSAPQELHVAADGTVTATVRVLNCGPVSLTLKLRARHTEGWAFDVDTPEMTLSAQSGPLTVKAVLKPPAGRSVDSGDQVTLELHAFDAVLASKDIRVQRSPPTPPTDSGSLPRRVGRVVGAGGVIAGVVIAAVLVALAALGSSGVNSWPDPPPGENGEPGGPPSGENDEAGGNNDEPTTVTDPPVAIDIPDLLGQDVTSAVATLQGLGLAEDVVPGDRPDASMEPGPVDQGTVIAQAPAAGEQAEPGTAVTLTEMSETRVMLPNLEGRPIDEAKSTITGLRLTHDTKATVRFIGDGETAPPNCTLVTKQTPEPADWVPLRSSVTLTYTDCQWTPS